MRRSSPVRNLGPVAGLLAALAIIELVAKLDTPSDQVNNTGPVSIALHFAGPRHTLSGVTQPLALVFFQKPLPGNQIVHRLQDLGYRVQVTSRPGDLDAEARTVGAMLLLADLDGAEEECVQVIRGLRVGEATRHLPIISIATSETVLNLARTAGSTLAVEPSALLSHLPAFLEQVLRVD